MARCTPPRRGGSCSVTTSRSSSSTATPRQSQPPAGICRSRKRGWQSNRRLADSRIWSLSGTNCKRPCCRKISVLESLRMELGLVADAEPDLGSLDFLLKILPLPERSAGEGEVQQWLPGVWQSHAASRIAEIELFQAEMGVIGAKRERFPRLTGSIGLGDI